MPLALRDRSRSERRAAWQRRSVAVAPPTGRYVREAERSAILKAANAVQHEAGRGSIGSTDPPEEPSEVSCKGCDRAMNAAFNSFCCGACRNLTAFLFDKGISPEANTLPHGVQKRHGPRCSEGELQVHIWRAHGRPTR